METGWKRKKNWDHMSLWSHLHSACFVILTTDKYLDDCPCYKTTNEVCSAIWMGRQEWISSSLFQRPDVFWLFARPYMSSQGGRLAKHASLSVANLTLNLLRSTWSFFSFPFWSYRQSLSCTDLCPCQAGDLCRNENTHLVISRNTNKDDDIWSHFFSFSSSLHLFHWIQLLLCT
jgi:hypothetical protein